MKGEIMEQIPKIKLGSTGREVSRLGFGGGFIVGDERVKENQAIEIVKKAIELGITYFDTASSYGKGESEKRIGKAISLVRDKIFLATKVKSRKAEEAEEELEGSFSRLNTDIIDLVQIHGIKGKEDLGAIEVVEEFKKQGKVHFIGITGHEPKVLIEALESFKFDTVMFPINPGEKYFGSFERLAEECRKRKIGSIGMKVIAQGEFIDPLEDYFSYALDYADVILVGIRTVEELEKTFKATKNIRELSEQEKRDLELKAEEVIKNSKKPVLWWRKS